MLCRLTVIVCLYVINAAPLVRVGWRPGIVFLAKTSFHFKGKLITL